MDRHLKSDGSEADRVFLLTKQRWCITAYIEDGPQLEDAWLDFEIQKSMEYTLRTWNIKDYQSRLVVVNQESYASYSSISHEAMSRK